MEPVKNGCGFSGVREAALIREEARSVRLLELNSTGVLSLFLEIQLLNPRGGLLEESESQSHEYITSALPPGSDGLPQSLHI